MSIDNLLFCSLSDQPFLLLPQRADFGTGIHEHAQGLLGLPLPIVFPTSFSGSFQQPAFPAQAAFPQQTAFSQQPNGEELTFG